MRRRSTACLNVINGDEGDNLSVPMSSNGQEPATHFLGSLPLTDEHKATYPFSKTAPAMVAA